MGRPSHGTLWTIDYRALWPDNRGLWRLAVVRAMSADEALAKLRAFERNVRSDVRLTQVRIAPGRAPGYPQDRIIEGTRTSANMRRSRPRSSRRSRSKRARS